MYTKQLLNLLSLITLLSISLCCHGAEHRATHNLSAATATPRHTDLPEEPASRCKTIAVSTACGCLSSIVTIKALFLCCTNPPLGPVLCCAAVSGGISVGLGTNLARTYQESDRSH